MKWKQTVCDVHEGLKRGQCDCEAPFRLYCFPSKLRNGQSREQWITCMKRQGEKNSLWSPTNSDRVCSTHFVDATPTPENPNPTLNMGYDLPPKKLRRPLFRSPVAVQAKKARISINENLQQQREEGESSEGNITQPMQGSSTFSPPVPPNSFLSPALSDHCYNKTPTKHCAACEDKSHLIDSLTTKLNSLTLRYKRANREKVFSRVKGSIFTWTKIKTDAKMNFYTGISSIKLFNIIFQLLYPFLPRLQYWRGPKRSYSKVKRNFKTAHNKLLSHKDEFLLTLIRLRLGVLNEDLADRFGISPTICSNTFTTWIKLLSKTLGDALVVWLPRESLRDNLPEVFVKTGHSKCRVIIDCAEVFIERSKSLVNQAVTWSDYKHHNTLKFLIGISPTGYITFLSCCYGGRATDKYITNDSGFYDLLEREDEIMADRGFQIREETTA